MGQLEVRLGQVEAFSPRNPPKGVNGRQTSQTRTHKASKGERKMINSVYRNPRRRGENKPSDENVVKMEDIQLQRLSAQQDEEIPHLALYRETWGL